MKLSTTLALTLCAGAAAFLAGHFSDRQASGEAAASNSAPAAALTKPLPPRGSREATAAEAVRAMGKYAACSQEFSAKNAALLTSEERMQLLTNGAMVGDYGNQAAMLCGLISTLSKAEILNAADILGGIQDRGNSQAQEVWNSLWKQWGRVDPEGCLALFGRDAVSKSSTDARNVMAGWLEMNADAALAWAQKPGKSPLEAAAAALAISRNANGDLKQLEAAILKLPAGEETSKVCLTDYFDIASLVGKDQTPAAIYDQMPAELRPAAWPVAARRIGLGDSATAKAWVTEHASDPGHDYDGLDDLFSSLTHEDPAATAKWAAQLPHSDATDRAMAYSFSKWRQRDPDAANAWLKTQPSVSQALPGHAN